MGVLMVLSLIAFAVEFARRKRRRDATAAFAMKPTPKVQQYAAAPKSPRKSPRRRKPLPKPVPRKPTYDTVPNGAAGGSAGDVVTQEYGRLPEDGDMSAGANLYDKVEDELERGATNRRALRIDDAESEPLGCRELQPQSRVADAASLQCGAAVAMVRGHEVVLAPGAEASELEPSAIVRDGRRIGADHPNGDA